MNLIIQVDNTETLRTSIVVTEKNKAYYVDTADTWDCGLETMVFPFNKKTKSVTNYSDLYCRHYKDFDTAIIGHDEICNHIEDYVMPLRRF